VNAEALRAALRCGRPDCACQWAHGNVHCPAHDDSNPSLAVAERDGRVLVYCHGGCSQAAVLAALRARGLWPERHEADSGLTLEELAAAKCLPPEFLAHLGVRDVRLDGRPAVAIPYHDPDGDETALRYRLALDGHERFRWRRGARVIPYGLSRLHDARAQGWVLLVEGESDCWTAWHHGLPALGLPGKSSWREEWTHALQGLEVFLWIEPGAADLVQRVAQDLPNVRVFPAPVGYKDLSDAHVRGDDVPELVGRVRAEAIPAEVFLARIEEERRRQAASEALPRARELLDNPHLLERVENALAALGLAGDCKPALVVYLVLTSRLLPRPCNAVLEGPSAAGKNYTLDCVVRLFPPDAVLPLTATSERALVYLEDDLRHRHVIVGEAAGLHRDGVGATVMRAIAWEGRLAYLTVEKTRDGLRPRRIDRPGPTGVITTTVKALEPELTTRFLTVPIRDDPTQTRAVVLEAGAVAANGGPRAIDLEPFVQAQRWLKTGGAKEVVIPYAQELARMVDVSAVRVRRDFSQLLTLIQACALLHQRQRGRDERGRVVADLEDYRIVYNLAAPLFGAATGLTQAQLEAVQAVRALHEETGTEVSVRQVADRLGLDKSAASRRLQRPMKEGYVVNLETHPGRPARLLPAETPPTPRPVLPTADELQRALAGVCNTPDNTRNTATPGPQPAPDAAENRCTPPAHHPHRCAATPLPLHEGTATPKAAPGLTPSPTVAALQPNTEDEHTHTASPAQGPDQEGALPRGITPADAEAIFGPVQVPYDGPADQGPALGPPSKSSAPPAGLCQACGSRRFWESTHGMLACATCHPPAAPDMVRRWRVRRPNGRSLALQPAHRARRLRVSSPPEGVRAAVRAFRTARGPRIPKPMGPTSQGVEAPEGKP
jgi:hypothetical protein